MNPMRTAARATLSAAIAFAPLIQVAHAQEAVGAPPSLFDSQAKEILEQLRVNEATQSRAHSAAARERPTRLASGIPESFALPLGGARTVLVPSDSDAGVVVNPDVAQIIVLGPGRVQVIARAPGATDLVFSNGRGEVYKAHVTVTANASPVQSAIAAALPGERITAAAINGSMVLSGTVRDAATATTAVSIARRFVADAASVVNNITIIGGQQVMLKVRVAEVNRTVVKQLGLDTAISGAHGTSIFGNSPNNSGYGAGSAVGGGTLTNPNTLGGVQPFLALASASNPIAFVSTKALGNVFTTVASALESQGLVRTLAEPNLVTQSGRAASMLAGAQYPVPTVSQSGRIGTEYHNFGVSLAFTPVVVSPGSIQLDIATEVSTKAENVAFPDGNGGSFNIPSFNTRKAQTVVELPSGGSIVIAGLVSDDFANTASGIPGLKDIPIIGKLLSSTDFQRHETELVISVTAIMVQSADAAAIGSPTDGMLAPTDNDLYLLGRLTGNARRPLPAPPRGITRDFGYITE